MHRKISSGNGKEETSPEALRRALLRAGVILPFGSTALLAACGGGGSGGGAAFPLAGMAPAASPAPAPAPESSSPPAEQAAAAEPQPLPVPPTEPPPPRPVQKAVKNVRILNLQTPTFTPPANQRKSGDDIKTYTQSALQGKFELLRDALTKGLPGKTGESDLCYFVVPEFYWNVNWDAVKNEDEIRIFSSTCVVEVQKHVRELIALFPQEKYGKLALLPGTTQVLKKQLGAAAAPAGAPASPVADKDLPTYEALNYVLVIDNFSKSNPDGSRPIAMWPKRHVSGIDLKMGGSVTKDGQSYWKALLGNLDILVTKRSTTVAAYFADGKEFKGFDNDPLGGVPFGVDVCLDYAAAYTDSEYTRMSQIEDTNFILDFLIACGMTVDERHKYLPSMQYIVRNDGMSYGKVNGTCEIYKLAGPSSGTRTALTGRPRNERVPQTEVARPRADSILFDSYIEIHPLWQYPIAPLPAGAPPSPPTEALPSLLA